MRGYFASFLAVLLVGILPMEKAYAEQTTTTPRKFKTWSVERTQEEKTKNSSSNSEWKRILAARAAKKQMEGKQAIAKKTELKTAALTKHKKNKNQKKAKAETKVLEGKEIAYNDSWRIKVCQQKLKQLGYLSQAPTGRMNESTSKALKSFQEQNSLKVTGRLDDKTYRRLDWLAFCKYGIKDITGAAVIKEAAKYKGVRYVFGGTTPKGFDCSGYTQYVFKQLRGSLTRTADTQALEGIFVTQKQLKPGDLVFFSTYEPGASHVGIYAGNNKFWNATSSRGIMLCGLQEEYWRTRYYGARRVLVSNGEAGS